MANSIMDNMEARIVREDDTAEAVLFKLRERFATMPSREEWSSGQRHRYVLQEEVIDWMDDAIAKIRAIKPTT